MLFQKPLLLGAALLILGAESAVAADLYGSAKDPYIPMEAPGPSWYFRIDGGYAFHDDPNMVEQGIFDLSDSKIGDTWTLGGGFGRYFTRNIRGDLTVDYRFEADVEGNRSGTEFRAFGLKSTVLLANLYYDFNPGERFSPYVGIALGWVRHETAGGNADTCDCGGSIDGDSSDDVAGALMAGFSWNLLAGRQEYAGSTKDGPVYASPSRNLYLDVGYRFLYLGEAKTGLVVNGLGDEFSRGIKVEEIHAHELRVGLRYDLR